MTHERPAIALFAAALVVALGATSLPATGQDHGAHAPGASSKRITMDALHAAGGTPPGWHFTLPPGDAAAGRRAFVELKCYACHAVKGEQFPLVPGESARAGPDLTGMGGHHPAEYLAESIVNPNAVLVDAPGYIGGDGRSIMPSIPEMTVGQLINLVAYLKSLGGGEPAGQPETAREQTAGAYRVRLVYKKPEAGHAHHAHGGGGHQAHGGGMAAGPGHLMAFVSDAASGQPIPYSAVKAKIESPKKAPRTLSLAPMLGPEGFHYGATVAVPDDTSRITLSIGATTMQLGAGAAPGLKRTETVTFDWK